MNDCCQIGLRTLNHLADNLGKHLPLLYVHVLSFPSLIQRAFMITAATRIKFTDAQVATLEEISKIDMGIYQFTHSLARCYVYRLSAVLFHRLIGHGLLNSFRIPS